MNTDNTPAAKLKELIEQNGQSLVYDADRTQQLLEAACPNNLTEVQALVTAQRLSIPWELLNGGPSPDGALVTRLTTSLEQGGPMSSDAARWIIQTWAHVLEIPLPSPTLEAAEPAPSPSEPAPVATEPAAAASAPGVPMYFILDGANRYGPADAATLTQWSAEGRLHDTMRFEEQGTGRQLQAHEVPGLFVTHPPQGAVGQPGMHQGPGLRPEQPYQQQGNPYQQAPGQGGQYYRPGGGAVDSVLSRKAVSALVKSIISTVFCSLCCCFPLGIIAIIVSVIAKNKADIGHPDAQGSVRTADVLANISLGLAVAGVILRVVLMFIPHSTYFRTYGPSGF